MSMPSCHMSRDLPESGENPRLRGHRVLTIIFKHLKKTIPEHYPGLSNFGGQNFSFMFNLSFNYVFACSGNDPV